MRDKYREAMPDVIGADIEDGGELLKYQMDGKVVGIVAVKGVAGYAHEYKSNEWFFTAAMAALKYTESKLCSYQSQEIISPPGKRELQKYV